MTSPNIARTHLYLQAVASLGPFENVADFYASDIVIQEFPNRIAPQGRIRRAADLRAAYEQGRNILQSQTYNENPGPLELGDDFIADFEDAPHAKSP